MPSVKRLVLFLKILKERRSMSQKLLEKDVSGLRQNYKDLGVVVVKNVLNKYWLEVLREAVEIQVKKEKRYFDNRNMRLEPGGFNDFCCQSGIGKIVADLVNSKRTALVFDQMFVKEVGTKTRTGWHTDQPYWPIAGPIMTTWIALDHVDDENGALEFIPGSHNWGKKYHPFLTDQLGSFVKYINPDDPQYDEMPDFEKDRSVYDIKSWPLKPGDMLAFDGFIVHSAKGNQTATRRRRGYAVRFATDGATYQPSQGVADWLMDDDLQEGDPFTSKKFPLIYNNS